MKELFGQPVIKKDGKAGKTIVLPDLEVLQLGGAGLLRRRQAAAAFSGCGIARAAQEHTPGRSTRSTMVRTLLSASERRWNISTLSS